MHEHEQFFKKRTWVASKGIIPSMYKGDATVIAIVAWLGNTTLNPWTHIHYMNTLYLS
jgi:hypothetical protein